MKMKCLVLGLCIIGSPFALAQTDFDEQKCPSVDFLSTIELSFQQTNIIGYDLQQNTLLGSLSQSQLEEESGTYAFTISGFPVANGKNIDDAGKPLIIQLKSENTVPFTYSIAANRSETNDSLDEEGPFYVCSYSLASDKRVSAIFTFNFKR